MTNKLEHIIRGLSVLGFLNAGYVTYLYFFVINANKNTFTVCDINNTFSCSQALSSGIDIFGVPPCTIALFVYPIIFWLTYLKDSFYNKAISILSLLGIFMNLWIIYEESKVGVYCLLCIICWIIIASIFGTSIFKQTKV